MKTPRSFRRHAIGVAALLALSPAAAPVFATSYDWSTGYYTAGVTAPSPLAAGDVLNIVSGGYKYLANGFGSSGTINAFDDLYFQSGAVITNAGLFDFKGDVGFYDGGYNGGIANSGIFRKSGGTGTSNISIGGFVNSGTIDTQTGVLSFNSGAVFNAGSQFTGAGRTVVSNGAAFNGAFTSQNLALTGGSFAGTGAQLSGSVGWSGGSLTGDWAIATGATLNALAGDYKYIAAGITNKGTLALADNVYFQSGNVVANQGLVDLQGDVSLYDGGYNGGVVNTGTFRKSAGSGTSYVGISGFANSGIVDVQSGTLNFNTGASFADGTRFTGFGQVVISNGASFSGTTQTAGNLAFTGGTFSGTGAKLDGDAHWSVGSLTGDWTLAAGRTLTLDAGNYKYLAGSFVNQGTVVANDTLYLQSGNTLTNNGSYVLAGDVSLADGGYNGNFVNNGSFTKTSGVGTSAVSINGFQNNGVIDAQTGTIAFNNGAVFNAGSQFTGAGEVQINGGATFNGAFTTSGHLTLANGSFVGNAAKIDGDTRWTVGYLTGGWEVGAGRTLTLGAGNYKYLDGSLTNSGTIDAQDTLYFQSGNTLTNQGVYRLNGDVNIADGGYNGNFINNASLVKTAGINTSYVSIAGFQNNGVIDVQTGTIDFSAGARFNDGSQFKGPGLVNISNGANFVGNFSTDGHLTLAAGTFTGGDGTAGSKATLALGSAVWSTGTLAGNWQVASGATLNLAAGNYKYVTGSVVNNGRIAAADTLYLQNGGTVTNQGVYDAQGDVGVADGGYSGHFINSGTFVKSSGTGNSDVSAVDFTNPGTVDVRSGTVTLPANFANPGTVTGAGAITTNVFTNSGHVAPGDGAGTLTLNGNYVQTATGSFDTELASSSLFDTFLVNGTASLAGTLAVDCIGACAVHTGDSFVILDATGDLTGSFASVSTHGFLNGFQYSVVYDNVADQVRLEVLNAGIPSPVPEPGSWALLAAGLGALGSLARRRRAAAAPCA